LLQENLAGVGRDRANYRQSALRIPRLKHRLSMILIDRGGFGVEVVGRKRREIVVVGPQTHAKA
jgi:hypothetical protein